MNHSKKRRLCLIVALAVVLTLNLLYVKWSLAQFSIWTEKNSFYLDTPVPVYYQIKNSLHSTIYLNRVEIQNSAELIDDNGVSYSSCDIYDGFGWPDTLLPGDSILGQLNVGNLLCARDSIEGRKHLPYLPEAEYSVFFAVPRSDGIVMRSNAIKIVIAQPPTE